MEVLNSSNLPVFQISDVDQVKRFLSLGSENGTYYISERDLTAINVASIENMLTSEDGRNDLLDIIKDYAVNRKCKKQEPLVYLLASCCTYRVNDPDFVSYRTKSYELVPQVCTIPTTLFMFIHYCKQLCKTKYNSNGWNNLHKRAISNWYKNKNASNLVYSLTKYKDRCGYTHKDVLRLAHIKPETEDQKLIFKYVASGYDSMCQDYHLVDSDVLEFIKDYERVKSATDVDMVVEGINRWKFAREHIPTNHLNNTDVWAALLPHMADIATLRNLNKLTSCGLFDNNFFIDMIQKKISNIKDIHPMHLLIALRMYNKGSGFRGSMTWNPVSHIVDALDKQFYKLFKTVKPTGKRVCIAMDVSASMQGAQAIGTECMSCAEVCCALAMVMKANDASVDVMGFSTGFVPLRIDPEESIETNMRRITNLPFQATDISLPFRHSLTHNKSYDAFVVLTDNETTFTINPTNELRRYRSTMKIPHCKLVVVAMAANSFSIADPNDKNMLDVAGFDASVPDVINEFIRGEI